MSELAEFYPCLQSEACTFRVIRQPGQAIIGQCERDPRGCPHITLTEPDITPLEFNWQKFGRALCRALNLEYKYRRMPIFQIQCLREFISPHSLLTLAAHSSRRPDYFKH